MREIRELEPGDYVKVGKKIHKIYDIWGISRMGRLAHPSKGGFWVELEDGSTVDMWHASAYYKATDKEVAHVVGKTT